MSKVYIVGVGPGSPEWVSDYAKTLIASADILVGWAQDFKPVTDLIKNQGIFLQECHNYLDIPKTAAIEAKKTGATVVVLKTGDPLVAPAGIEGVIEIFDGFDVQVVPGISTVQIAAAKAHVQLDNAAIITYHPLPHDGGGDLRKKRKRMLSALQDGRNLIVLTGVRQMPNQTAQFLLANKVDLNLQCVVCENLTLINERISRCGLKDVSNRKFDWQSIIVIIN